jgi:LacI family transcriptional regulator
MTITLQEIAHLTGTSPSTVSRAIRGSGRISKKTRDRVIAVAEQFDYRPNLVARSMVRRSTQLIGVVLPMTASGPFSRVIGGIERSARKEGFSVVFCQTDDDEQILQEHLHLLGCRRVDGVLLCPHGDRRFSLSCLDRLGPPGTRVPVVLVQEPYEQNTHASVTVDNFGGARALCGHLVEHGHRDMGFLAFRLNRTGAERYRGFRAAMQEAGEDPERVKRVEVRLKPGPLTEDPAGYIDPAWMEETLTAHPEWTALAVEHDMLAIKTIQALQRIGRKVPDDLAVVGFDDVLVSAFVDPPLTTVRQPTGEVGETACNLLLEFIAGKRESAEQASVRVPCTLQVRESCGCSQAEAGS